MNRRLQLIHHVRALHNVQLIKDTTQRYFDHVLAVANNASEAAPLAFEIGLCHDLLEKTPTTQSELFNALIGFGYDEQDAEHISHCVNELTRHFTKADNPLPKKMRKALEEERLLTISPDAQTVKYADWAYNADWMMQHDRHHAADYLTHHIGLMEQMTEGDAKLRDAVLKQFGRLLSLLLHQHRD